MSGLELLQQKRREMIELEAEMTRNLKMLNEKMQALSTEQIAEVGEFVEFLRFKSQDREMTRAASAASAASFESVWNNAEDDVYDAL